MTSIIFFPKRIDVWVSNIWKFRFNQNGWALFLKRSNLYDYVINAFKLFFEQSNSDDQCWECNFFIKTAVKFKNIGTGTSKIKISIALRSNFVRKKIHINMIVLNALYDRFRFLFSFSLPNVNDFMWNVPF